MSNPLDPGLGKLNSIEHSNNPESIEPENLNGLDLIIVNNENAKKPNVLKKLIGAYKGVCFRGTGDIPKITKETDGGIINTALEFMGALDLHKIRVRIPELHSHLPPLGENPQDVPPTIAALYPEFIAESTDVSEPTPGTIVWCNFLDRENYKDPVYLGPVDDKKSGVGGTAQGILGSLANSVGGLFDGLSGNPGKGDPFGGVNYKNPAGQVSYPQVTGSWSGQLPVNGFTSTTATVEDLIKIARAQINKVEIPKGSNGGPQVDPFNGARHEAWCAAGITWCFRQIGAPLPGDKIPYPGGNGYNLSHSVTHIQKWAMALGYWFQQPQPGDMVIYNTSDNPDLVNSSKHIGLVVAVDGDIMETIEFNWGDGVYVTKQDWKRQEIIKKGGVRKKSYKVTGFARRPLPYSGVSGGQVTQIEQSFKVPTTGYEGLTLPEQPGEYDSYNKGELEGRFQMINISGTDKLYPQKYINALTALRIQYNRDTGKELTITSGFRSYQFQQKLYSEYLAKNRTGAVVAPPGHSLHNNGRAIDFGTGEEFNNKFATDFIPPGVNKEEALNAARSGRYGPVAQWLVNNGFKFGYIWTGYSFRELWHYEIDLNIAREKGLIT